MLDDVSDVRNVFIYNDCNRNKNQTGTETRKAWVRAQYAFADDSPRDHAQGYEEVVFERLTQQQYLIESK